VARPYVEATYRVLSRVTLLFEDESTPDELAYFNGMRRQAVALHDVLQVLLDLALAFVAATCLQERRLSGYEKKTRDAAWCFYSQTKQYVEGFRARLLRPIFNEVAPILGMDIDETAALRKELYGKIISAAYSQFGPPGVMESDSSSQPAQFSGERDEPSSDEEPEEPEVVFQNSDDEASISPVLVKAEISVTVPARVRVSAQQRYEASQADFHWELNVRSVDPVSFPPTLDIPQPQLVMAGPLMGPEEIEARRNALDVNHFSALLKQEGTHLAVYSDRREANEWASNDLVVALPLLHATDDDLTIIDYLIGRLITQWLPSDGPFCFAHFHPIGDKGILAAALLAAFPQIQVFAYDQKPEVCRKLIESVDEALVRKGQISDRYTVYGTPEEVGEEAWKSHIIYIEDDADVTQKNKEQMRRDAEIAQENILRYDESKFQLLLSHRSPAYHFYSEFEFVGEIAEITLFMYRRKQ
jgi:hypothetical protein